MLQTPGMVVPNGGGPRADALKHGKQICRTRPLKGLTLQSSPLQSVHPFMLVCSTFSGKSFQTGQRGPETYREVATSRTSGSDKAWLLLSSSAKKRWRWIQLGTMEATRLANWSMEYLKSSPCLVHSCRIHDQRGRVWYAHRLAK